MLKLVRLCMVQDTNPYNVSVLLTEKDFELFAVLHAAFNVSPEEMDEFDKKVSSQLFDLMNRYQSAVSHSILEIPA